jgi:L-malate glycosyltransferase
MKVLHLITGDVWAGAEVQMSGLVRALAIGLGVQQEVVTFNDGTLAFRLRQQGVPVEVVSEAKHGLPGLVTACRKIMAGFEPDILHAHGFKENLVGGIAARLRGTRVVRTHHGKGMIGAALRYDVVERLNARLLSDRLIVVSSDLGQFLGNCGLPRKKMTVVLNGMNPLEPSSRQEVVALKRQLGLPEDAVVVGTTGRLIPVKDHADFLRAARIISQADSRARFVIVGDGPLMSELVGEAETLGIRGVTVFSGFREDAARLGEVFDVFALTSRHEGIPMALLEAMSLGKPVVVTNVGGMPEVVSDGANGILVPPGDPGAFARACLELLGDPSLRRRLSETAAADIRDQFSGDGCARRTLAVYREVLAA